MFQVEFLAHFRTQGRAFTHIFAELFGLEIACIRKKLRPLKDRPFSHFLSAHTWEELFTVIFLKTRLEVSDLAEFLIFFTKKVPDNIAALRLKIGRSYAVLQPFKATSCWNLNQLFWPLSRWRQTFGLVCLAGQ